MMVKKKLYFVELLKASVGWLLYLKWAGFRWPTRAILNLLVVAMGLSLMLSSHEAKMLGVSPVFPAEAMAAMGGYSDYRGYTSPIVAITVPADGSIFVAPANILIFAGAVDFKAGVTKVNFYQNSVLLYEDMYQPYSYTWRNVPDGNYIITVTATNSNGVTAISVPVYITVLDPTASGCTCPAGCSDRTDISPPFSIDGAGEYCWETTSLGAYVFSMNMDTLLINGVNLKNCWTNKLPPARNGKYYIYYESRNELGHFEMK